MNLSDMTLQSYISLLASQAGAPGGGSASALTGAQGAALCAMVCSLTAGKKKYEEDLPLIERVHPQAEALYRRFLDLMNKDTLAFNGVTAVFAMPRDTEEQKAERKEKMQQALKNCTFPPVQMMEAADAALKLVSEILGHSNASALSDLGCAALSLKASVQGAWLNAAINLSGIRDEDFAAEYRARGEKLLKSAAETADAVYNSVLEQL